MRGMTPERRAAILADYTAGKSFADIRKAHGSMRETVLKLAQEAQAERPAKQPRWPDEAVATLRDMAAKGKSGGQIAKALKGFTRLAVVGKASRLGIQLKGTPPGSMPRPRSSDPLEPKKPRQPRERTPHAPIYMHRVAETERLRALSDRGRIFADRFLAAGWKPAEVAHLFDCDVDELIGRAAA